MPTVIKRTAAWVGLLLLGLVILGTALWGVLALFYFDHANPALRTALAAAYGVASLVALALFIARSRRWHAFLAQLALFGIVLACWSGIKPSNDRHWVTENAVLPYATFEGEHVTLHNIRNNDYRTETDFTPRYYDRTFDLQQLNSVDLFAVYWMGPAIAHVFVSFGFADGNHLAISIEARNERGEGYSTIKGFFRQYTLYYDVGDERDIVRLRTNYRKDPPEEVHLYRLHGPVGNGRAVFLDYLREINSLKDHPAFYNTLTTNCTSNIWLHGRVNPGHVPYSWKILLSGHFPEYLYEMGRLDTSLPFDELQKRSVVNPLAQAADQAEDFSQRIRALQPHP
jgi:Domain of unknown function (DUF4105)